MDGTLAAKRLNQGKQMVRDLIAYQLCSYYHPNKKQQQQCSNEEYILANLRDTKRKRRRSLGKQHTSKVTPQPFIISGHGIPKQLLQDHLNLCSQIISHLQREQIMTGGECFFHHSHTNTNTNNNNHNDTTGSSSPIILHVRNKGDKNKVISWPFSNTTTGSFQDRLELYLTVMNRISSTLVQILMKTTETTTTNYYEDKIPHQLQPRKQYPSYWNVHFAVQEDAEDKCHLYATTTTSTDTTLYRDLSYRDPPFVIAQLSVRTNSNSTNLHYPSKAVNDNDNHHHKSSTISNTTNVRIQIHGRECKDKGNTKATNSQVSVIYEACFFSQ
jgi:hypothetical protein